LAKARGDPFRIPGETMAKKLEKFLTAGYPDCYKISIVFSDKCEACGQEKGGSEMFEAVLVKGASRVETADELEKFARRIWKHI
jgi:hypothetical protein